MNNKDKLCTDAIISLPTWIACV